MKPLRIALLASVAICLIAVSAVSFHSVEEIHYLKSFYPARFTVPEAAAAAVVELIKVSLVLKARSLAGLIQMIYIINRIRSPRQYVHSVKIQKQGWFMRTV